ncbi:MAG: hypothetical protein RLZZ297_1913, partial [Chloroflexota bacterium]
PARSLPPAIVASSNRCLPQSLHPAIVASRNRCHPQSLPSAIVATRNRCHLQSLPPAIVATHNRCHPQSLPYAIVASRNCPISYYLTLLSPCLSASAAPQQQCKTCKRPTPSRGSRAVRVRMPTTYGVITPVLCSTCGEIVGLAILSSNSVRFVLGSTNQMLPLFNISTINSRSRNRSNSGLARYDDPCT